MASIEDFRKIMQGLDAWNEAAGFVRPEDVERWNADAQITLKTFPILLKMCITAPTVRSQLLADNLLLIGVAEAAATQQYLPAQQPSTKADEPEDKDEFIDEDRPREDFHIGLDYWTKLDQVFLLGQKTHMADSLLGNCKKNAPKDEVTELRGANYSYEDVFAYDGPPGEQCVQMCSNVYTKHFDTFQHIGAQSTHLSTFEHISTHFNTFQHISGAVPALWTNQGPARKGTKAYAEGTRRNFLSNGHFSPSSALAGFVTTTGSRCEGACFR